MAVDVKEVPCQNLSSTVLVESASLALGALAVLGYLVFHLSTSPFLFSLPSIKTVDTGLAHSLAHTWALISLDSERESCILK